MLCLLNGHKDILLFSCFIVLTLVSCGSVGKESACNTGDLDLIPGLGRSPGEGNDNPVFLPGEFYGQKSLAGYSLWDSKE